MMNNHEDTEEEVLSSSSSDEIPQFDNNENLLKTEKDSEKIPRS